MTDPPLAVRERRRDSTPGDSSSAQMNARHEDGTPDRAWLAELLRPLLILRGWSH